VTIWINSGPALARAVMAKVKSIPSGVSIVQVPEFAAKPLDPCDSTELLSWMGWMTAGPPTLAAETLRSAGLWAWFRYRWALGDARGVVRPTAEARAIRQHTRSVFSETVGVGAAGYLGCRRLFPYGPLGVANLDDSIEPLLRSGLIRRGFGSGRKQPDYLIATGLRSGAVELLAIECKGTVKSEKMAIGQLAAGVRQVLGIESDHPLRRIVLATTLELDEKDPQVQCHAIEVEVARGREVTPSLESAREAVRDAALIRALRTAGHYEAAERTRLGYVEEWPLPGDDETFEISGREVVGRRVSFENVDVRLSAAVGVDREVLQALQGPRATRNARLESALEGLPLTDERRRGSIRTPERIEEEALMRDGLTVHFEMEGAIPGEGDETTSIQEER
jgi:hypothetical protein